jgi:hypothetical protein
VTMTTLLLLARHVGQRQTFAIMRRPFPNQTTPTPRPEHRGQSIEGAPGGHRERRTPVDKNAASQGLAGPFVDGFLKLHRVPLEYTIDDFESERVTSFRLWQKHELA